MQKKIIYVALLISVLSSCVKSDEKKELEFFSEEIQNLALENTYDWIVILPSLGCKGCIQEAELFMQNNVNNKKILFVLTKIESLKVLQKKIGFNIGEHTNILLDRMDKLVVPTDNSIYPCILKLMDGVVVSHGFQSPRNSEAFYELKQRITDE